MDLSELFVTKYFDTIHKNGQAFYKQHDDFLTNVFNKNPEHKSTYTQPVTNLDKVDLNQLLLKDNLNPCSECEDVSDKEFSECLECLNFCTKPNQNLKPVHPQPPFKPVFNKSISFERRTENKLKKIYYPSSEENTRCIEQCGNTSQNLNSDNQNSFRRDFKNTNNFEAQAGTSKNSAAPNSFRTAHDEFGTSHNTHNNSNAGPATIFKTASDELHLQNNRKFGSSNYQNVSNGGGPAKRSLGANRRNVKSRFISPLLSNNSSSEEIRPEAKSEPVDERLKHIELEMVELIKSEIMDCGPGISWDDIAGLDFAKTAIQEAVVWPMLRPDIFTGLRRPPKGILLFGPPGTGKTLIGKCVAAQSKSTFFSISASSLTSKWIGNGEKMVRALFAVARVHQPSVIFIDEIDSLLSQRSDTEHESSRRLKTEFLVQLDGATTDNEEKILVIGATNRPQELDEAARRRFVKRLYIPLPECEARRHLVQKLISNERHTLLEEDFEQIAVSSDGYSGADIRNLCSEASLGPIRALDMRFIEKIQATEVRPLAMSDFRMAFARVKSSVALKDLEQYKLYDQTYGSGSGF